MPIFEVETPDGSTIEVEAPEGATQEQVLRFASQQFQPQEKAPLETGQALTEVATRGATLGFADPAIALGGALIAKAMGVDDATLTELTEEATQRMTARRQQAREEMPITTGAVEIGASLPVGGGVFKGAQALAKGANIGRAATPTALAATGAVEAGGLSEAETTEGILKDAVTGAVLAPVGAKVFEKATPFIAKKVTQFADGVSQPVKTIAESLFKVNPVVVKNFTESGVKPSLLAVTDSPTIKRLGSILNGTLGSTSVVTNNIDETLQGIERGVARLAKQQGEITGQQAGERIQSGIRGFVNKFQSTSDKLYKRLDRLIKPDDVAEVGNATNLFNRELKKFPDQTRLQGRLQSSPAFKLLSDISQDSVDGKLPYNALSAYRTEVGKIIKENTFTGKDNALAKQLYAALSEDMRGVAESKGAKALKAFDNANNFYSEGITKIEGSLKKYISETADAGQIFNQLKTASKVGDVKASKILNAIPKADRELVRDAVVQRLGRSSTGDFSVARFVSDYNRLTPEGRSVLFGNQGTQYRKSLDTLVDVSKTLRESQEFVNTSRTADNLGNVGLLALGAIDPSSAVTTGVGANLSARLLTNEDFVKSLAKAADQPINRGTFRTFLKRMEQTAINNPAIKDDISQYIGIVGAYMGQAMGENK
mgnify:CR=1 FL=1